MGENSRGEASQKFPTRPVAPLGVIAMRGCEEIGRRVNEYLLRWQVSSEAESETTEENLHSRWKLVVSYR